MQKGPAVVGILLAAALAGCAEVDDGALEATPDFHSATILPDGSYHCEGCHYGVDPVWQADWEGAGEDQWDLVIRSAWPDVELLTVDVVEGNGTPFAFDTGFLYEDMEGGWTYTFDVPDGATSLFVRFYTGEKGVGTGPYYADDPRTTVHPSTQLDLIAPDGARITVDGPEDELKQVSLKDPAPGTWAFEASVDEDVEVLGRAYVHVGMGPAAQDLAFGDAARFSFNGTVPPDVSVSVRPYHDHAPFEYGGLDWDYADSFLYDSVVRTLLGPAPAPYEWTTPVVDGFWDGANEIPIQNDRTVAMAAAYQEEEGTQSEDPLTGKASSPYYYTRSDPVPPGTGIVRFDVTWSPAVEEPDLQIRYGPAVTPYYRDAVAVERGVGFATFEAEWKTEWWDVHFIDGEPVLDERGSVDIAPYIAAEDGEAKAYSIELTLNAYAVRGPV